MVTTARSWENWGRTASCSPARVASPSGEEEIAQAVKDAQRDGLTVKVAGTGHSFTDIACTDGVLLQLGRHNRLLAVDQSEVPAVSSSLNGHGIDPP